jgi:hypothetical protein
MLSRPFIINVLFTIICISQQSLKADQPKKLILAEIVNNGLYVYSVNDKNLAKLIPFTDKNDRVDMATIKKENNLLKIIINKSIRKHRSLEEEFTINPVTYRSNKSKEIISEVIEDARYLNDVVSSIKETWFSEQGEIAKETTYVQRGYDKNIDFKPTSWKSNIVNGLQVIS